ncbi:aspartic peptidase domain-containing protein [Radiomyces spectabilis]|uniref:aspartic peptidase domain-containing protein n=1 Tax=Radiomyces spectabilis TaxID=64574 RepID=UPI00222078B5|nr:aspartic peptidase domain-containing protein [Radiomyces spectabilis]KAI8390987.1 aspartic peptidase domain-containing protein [Radiomyces spectabilis]
MHITSSIGLLLAALATASLASPVNHNAAADNGLVRVPIIRKPRKTDMLTARQRRSNTLNKRDPFQTSLYNDEGSQYLIQVGVGTPPQNFTVTLDTGSADLWVPSTECPSKTCPFTNFDASKSSTFKSLDQPFGITYGIGNVNGTYATDTVTVAGATVPDQQFGLASTTSDILTVQGAQGGETDDSEVQANGILGLGYPQLTAGVTRGEAPYNPFVFNLMDKNIIANPVFSVYMNRASEEGWAGEVIFGGVDDTKYTGNLTYLPVASLVPSHRSRRDGRSNTNGYFYWMVHGQGFALKGGDKVKDMSFPLRDIGAFILDTGTTLTYLPMDMANQILEALVGRRGFALDRQSGTYVVDCKAASTGSSFQLFMSPTGKVTNNPVTLSVPIADMVIPLDADTPEEARACMFGIAPTAPSGGQSQGSEMILIGDSVLRSSYLVFDMGKNRVGIAAAKGSGGSVDGNQATAEADTSQPPTGSAVSLTPAGYTTLSALCILSSILWTAL